MKAYSIYGLLDQACGQAVHSWFQGKECDPVKAYEAMEDLPIKLGRKELPDYDDHYTPPAYLIRYQLGHTLMAWQVLTRLSRRRDNWHQGSVRIIDFGAGTSACRMGAALMLERAIRNKHDVMGVQVEEVDVSASMQAMGELIWQAFVAGVRFGFANTPLAQAVEIIDSRQHKDWRNLGEHEGVTWLTAFHSIYPMSYNMEEEIGSLVRTTEPALGAFSCHKDNFGKLKEAFPFHIYGKRDKGYFPKFRGEADGKVFCPKLHMGYRGATTHIGEAAVAFGFRKKNLSPFLQVKDCAILLGDIIPF